MNKHYIEILGYEVVGCSNMNGNYICPNCKRAMRLEESYISERVIHRILNCRNCKKKYLQKEEL